MNIFSQHIDKMTDDYRYCYEWRKVAHNSVMWSLLPPEIIDLIAYNCKEPLPTGLYNMSRADSKAFWIDWTL